MIFSGTKTSLETGDEIIFRRRQRTISFFRDNKPLLLSNGDDRIPFALEEIDFKNFVVVLAESHNFESSTMLNIREANFSYLEISEEDCISFQF